MTTPHTQEMENAGLAETNWDRWIDRVEKLVGHDLDGDEKQDGYSLDGCGAMFSAGKRPLDAALIIKCRKASIAHPKINTN